MRSPLLCAVLGVGVLALLAAATEDKEEQVVQTALTAGWVIELETNTREFFTIILRLNLVKIQALHMMYFGSLITFVKNNFFEKMHYFAQKIQSANFSIFTPTLECHEAPKHFLVINSSRIFSAHLLGSFDGQIYTY